MIGPRSAGPASNETTPCTLFRAGGTPRSRNETQSYRRIRRGELLTAGISTAECGRSRPFLKQSPGPLRDEPSWQPYRAGVARQSPATVDYDERPLLTSSLSPSSAPTPHFRNEPHAGRAERRPAGNRGAIGRRRAIRGFPKVATARGLVGPERADPRSRNEQDISHSFGFQSLRRTNTAL